MANILIVDDDPAVQVTIRLLLERAGRSATVAGDGCLEAGRPAASSEEPGVGTGCQ